MILYSKVLYLVCVCVRVEHFELIELIVINRRKAQNALLKRYKKKPTQYEWRR